MPMVQVRPMRMRMLPLIVDVPVGVLSRGMTGKVAMVMVNVVMAMPMLMLHGLMPMRMVVLFSREQDHGQDE